MLTRRLIAAGAALLTLAAIAFAIQFYRNALGLLLFNEQYLSGMLGLGMALVYLTQPAARATPRPYVPWYDWLLAAVSLAVGGYLVWKFPDFSANMTSRPIDGLVVAFVTIPLVVEALRRCAGWALTIVVLVFLGYALIGHMVPGALAGRYVRITQLAFYLVWDPGSMLGLPLMVATTIVVAFIFFGQLLFASGGSAFFTDIALALMGRYRGGSAKIAVLRFVPVRHDLGQRREQRRLRRRHHHSADAARRLSRPCRRGDRSRRLDRRPVDAAGDGRRRVPDGRIPASALPRRRARRDAAGLALLLCAVHPGRPRWPRAAALPRSNGTHDPADRQVLAQGWHFLAPFAVLIYGLFWLNWSPEMSALAGAAVLVATGITLGYGDKRLRPRTSSTRYRGTGLASLDLIMITAAAGFIIGVLNITRPELRADAAAGADRLEQSIGCC